MPKRLSISSSTKAEAFASFVAERAQVTDVVLILRDEGVSMREDSVGFSIVFSDPDFLTCLPDLLRSVADQIDEDRAALLFAATGRGGGDA